MRELKQSTAANVMVFMTDSADHFTGKTGLALTVTASKDGAAFASISPSVTERGNGWYNVALTTSHTDTLGELAFHITGTAADPADFKCRVVAANPGELTTAERTATANEVEAQIIDDSDSEKVLEAIVNKINSMTDLDALTLAAIASAVRSELATELARIDAAISSRSTLTAAQVMAAGSIDGFSLEGFARLVLAVLVGRLSGVDADSPVFRDAANTKNRVSATTTSDGRTAVTLDAS